ncbi:MAG: hypothetical protein OSJ55_03050 [Bacteroidales bacterium]|nr:hypothetical protein [Bacteroidales bacterium]
MEGIECGKIAARASIAAPAKTIIQSSEPNCFSHFFILFKSLSVSIVKNGANILQNQAYSKL